MFIIVKYGNNESLICNPSCAVINLLGSIKRRAGYGNSNVTIDLSDETGLIKELDTHKSDNANKHLESHTTYVLVQKEIMMDNLSTDSASTPSPPQINYIPLLDNYSEIFPNFQIRSEHLLKTTKQKGRTGKSPSPAGRLPKVKKAVPGKSSARRK